MRLLNTDVSFNRESVSSLISLGHAEESSGSTRLTSRRSTASEAQEAFVSPLFYTGSNKSLVTEKEGEKGRVSSPGGGATREGERKRTLSLLVTSNDRLEFTLSPGALETILKLLEVHTVLLLLYVQHLSAFLQIQSKPVHA